LKGFSSTRVDGSHVAGAAGLIIVDYDVATHSLYPKYGKTYFKVCKVIPQNIECYGFYRSKPVKAGNG
jgi:hypothetical protein